MANGPADVFRNPLFTTCIIPYFSRKTRKKEAAVSTASFWSIILFFCIQIGAVNGMSYRCFGKTSGNVSSAAFGTYACLQAYGSRYKFGIGTIALMNGVCDMLSFMSHDYGRSRVGINVTGCFKGNIRFVGTVNIFAVLAGLALFDAEPLPHPFGCG